MRPPGQQQLRALFQTHRLILRYGNGSGTSVSARQRRTGQRGQRAVAHITGHRDIGTIGSGRNRRHQPRRAAGECPVNTVSLCPGEGIAGALHGIAVGYIDVGTELGIRCVQGTGNIDIARHRCASQLRRAACMNLQGIGSTQRGICHRQLTAVIHRERAHARDIGIRQLHLTAVIDIQRV